ncbi:putative monovalent cation/H+ antiporter subunit A [Chelativorans sp. SCAU2101]|uniref:Monovalent cation/H+ antiporter subunit A n=1 Tax=Chelativorans petroleitrophicus TaxID=2975484 RepID=A0A9X2XBK5_9HYPH|nr:putative monovalent cation/H+ antiporter subunit A [Chelativorans petroleitrophicus]MCT8991661.1 putative monovalent cation/H+ antiporter subunit A [Chelativorans petroleitrophicus]
MVADEQWMTFLTLVLPFLAAAVAPLLTRVLGHNAAWVLAVVPAFIFLHFTGFLGSVASGEPIAGGYPWIPSIGVEFSWYLDGLSLTFALLISGIGTLIILYSGGYLRGHPHQGRFFSFILMFMGAMQGLVVADSFLMLFVFWELTSIASFLLIGFDHSREAARRAALQALIVTCAGGLSLLAGLLVIAAATGTSSLSSLLAAGEGLREAPVYFAALLLVLGGAFTKSAQFPFHFWLPNAMEAPTPVSAYLHSATMVKAGVYLVMRLNPVMGETFAWETILPVFGGTTLIAGTLLALRQTDLKLMLAYTTVASLGLLIMLTGFGSEVAVEAAVLYLVAHSMFKGALFMVAGAIDHETGTRDIRKLGGIGKAMPITFAAAVLAAFSMGGLPPFFGFLAKEEIYAGLAAGSSWGVLLTLTAIAGNALMFAIGFAVGLKPFAGARGETPKHPHEGPVLLWLGPAVLAASGLLASLLSGLSHHFVSSPMASAVIGAPVEVTISWVPHLGMPLLLSALTVALGIAFYATLERGRGTMAAVLAAIGWGPDRGFDQLVRGTIRCSAAVTRTVHNGRLDIYMTVTFIVLAICLLVPMVSYGELPSMPVLEQLRIYEWAVLAIALIGVAAVVYARDRLTAIACLGIQGFAVALLFMLLGAPDLSFTQFMVETLSVVILALVMTRLRLYPADHRPASQKLLDFSVSSLCGLGFFLILLRVVQTPFDPSLSTFFAENSRVIAHGRNIVNVIIVDFRGLDTLGEISVVMIAGLAILALVRVRVGKSREKAIQEEART